MPLKHLSLGAVSLLLTVLLHAQSDSAAFNTGTLHLSRQFTQNITIKGEDLERLPFSSLEQAINVYFGGIYATAQDILYVVDGNTDVDVNAYSIHDIESITLLQDARAVVAGARRAQQLVLIRTRTNVNRSGFVADASSYYTKRRHQSKSNFYHQLYASGRFTRKRTEMGISLNYLHEAYPTKAAEKLFAYDPQRLDRFAATAWLKTTIKRSVLTVRLNASPGKYGTGRYLQETTYYSRNEDEQSKNLQLYPTASLFTRFNDQFYNKLEGGYLKKSYTSTYEQLTNYDDGGFYRVRGDDRNRYDKLFLREEFGVNYSLDKWHFNPAMNIYGLHTKNYIRLDSTAVDDASLSYAQSLSEYTFKERGIVFTPAINISNDLNFNFQGGVQLSTIKRAAMQSRDDKMHPFASLSVDVLKLINRDAVPGLMLHGSYAEAPSDLLNYFYPSRIVYTYNNGQFDTITMPILFGNLYKPRHITSQGLTFSIMGGRLKFDYTQEQKNYFLDSDITTTNGDGFTIILNASKVNLHTSRFGVQYQTAEGKQFKYSAMLSVYSMKSSFEPSIPNMSPVKSQHLFPPTGLSGGLSNQINYRRFTASVSCVYYFNKHEWVSDSPSGYPSTLQKLNSVVLQHIYAGYQFNRFEAYLSGRNILGNAETSFVNGDIAYYGAGIKTQL